MMEVMVTTGQSRVQSSSQIIITNKPTPNVFTGQMPFLSPTNSVKALKGKHPMDLLTPNSPSNFD